MVSVLIAIEGHRYLYYITSVDKFPLLALSVVASVFIYSLTQSLSFVGYLLCDRHWTEQGQGNQFGNETHSLKRSASIMTLEIKSIGLKAKQKY